MKRLVFVVLLLTTVVSCKNELTKRQIVVNKYLKEEFTEIELKTVTTSEMKISDRDYSDEVYKYLMSWVDFYQGLWKNAESHEAKMNGYRKQEAALGDVEEWNKNVATFQGNKTYTRVITLRMNPDTVHYGVLYFNELDSLVKYIHYK